jgi:dTDP-4-dehydrorhamnose 3,5-epimerase
MIFVETELPGAFVVELERREDERGFFARAWCRREFEEHRLAPQFLQCNISFNEQSGTLRGMHYQVAPHEEAKLVRCTRGAIYDVVIDLRRSSPTFKRWIGVELTAANRRALYVPEGFAHGYQTLTDETETFYQVSEFYTPDAERGLRWDDSSFAIKWPEVEVRIISEKDQSWPDFKG